MDLSVPARPVALIVEDDQFQRETLEVLFTENEIDVIQCESAEAAALVLEECGRSLSILFTDVNLAGQMDGVELAGLAKARFPDLCVIITSGAPLVRRLPDGTTFWAKPWRPLDVVRIAQDAVH